MIPLSMSIDYYCCHWFYESLPMHLSKMDFHITNRNYIPYYLKTYNFCHWFYESLPMYLSKVDFHITIIYNLSIIFK